MTTFNCMYPILPGKEDLVRSFAKELEGPRRDQFDALERRAGVSRETWTIQQTPAGPAMLIWFDGDVELAFAHLATDDDEFTTWFRSRVHEISGIDLAVPDDEPLPVLVLEWPA